MSTASTQAREVVFPGYQLFERIGSGGYAEVWRARAPGGIDKAVKIVYGCYGDQLAAQEMKAMERIKDVRHPFVLSLERFEVVDGRLAILTELADMSLEQRAQQCRAQGLPGIPREELLGFIADTAEALDFLAERHSLQHLDIKPANLLISGDHVKVADFGLVKELATRTQNSMVAGMTPTYSAPEMFDDAPAPQSDQYSLAIVYQEMLTGVLPFPGKTTAQLANQHLRSEPQLATLPVNDRTAVARALAKDPAERFPNCRAFVAALRGIAEPAAPVNRSTAAPAQPAIDSSREVPRVQPPPPPHVVKNLAPPRPALGGSTATQPTESQSHASADTKVDLIRAVKAQPKEEVTDVVVPPVETASNTAPPTLYIALGGVGIRILSRLRDQLARSATTSNGSPAGESLRTEMLALDTDRTELKQACSNNWSDPLPVADTLHLALRLPQEYRDREQGNLDWLSRRWLYNIPRSLETRGYRPLGRLALVDHVDRLLPLIDDKLTQLAATAPADDQTPPPEIRVMLLSSMGGGTGSGIAIDLANAVRSRLQSAKRQGKIEAVFVCSCLADVAASPLSVANTYALMTELQFASVFGNQGKQPESEALTALESHARPFDLVYCVTAKHATDESADDALCAIAQQLSLVSTDGVGPVLRNCRWTPSARESGDHEPLLLRSFNSAPLVAGPKQSRVNRLATFLAHAVQQNWLSEADPIQWQLLDQAGDADTSKPQAVGHSATGEHAKTAVATVKDPAPTKNFPVAKSPAPVKSPTEKWRECFGEHSKSRFAYEVISRIFKQAALQGAYRKTFCSLNNPARFAERVWQGISAIDARVAEDFGEAPSGEDEIIVRALVSCSPRVLTKLIDEFELAPAETEFDAAAIQRIVVGECAAVVKENLTRKQNADVPGALQTDMQQALARTDVDLLQCGYDRRTLIIAPNSNPPSDAVDALKKIRPAAAVVTAAVDDALLFCDASGIRASSFTRALEHVYPGIATAARRFFTRIDIDWSAGLE